MATRKSSVTLKPGAWRAELGEAWFDGVEDLKNKGIVSSVSDLREKISTPEARESLLTEANKVSPKWYDKIHNWFKKSPWALLSPIGIGVQAADKESPLRKGLSSINQALSPDTTLEQAQKEYQKQQLGIASKGIPEEIERLQQRRDLPYLEQAFGQTGGQLAGGVNTAILSELSRGPASQFSGTSQSGYSGPILSALLGTLASQSLPAASKYAQEYGPQAGQYIKGRGNALLDYLRGLQP